MPRYFLGLAHEHDSGVALFDAETGRMAYAANEERFNREKFTLELPRQSLRDAFLQLGSGPSDVTGVALGSRNHVNFALNEWFATPPHLKAILAFLSASRLDRLLFGTVAGSQSIVWALSVLMLGPRLRTVRGFLADAGVRADRIRVVEHHHAHASSAYAGSGWPDAIVITLDAQGDGDCSRVYVGSNGRMELKHRIPFFHSPGHYYEYVTHLLGFKRGREGKVTGLAANGDPAKTLGVFQERLAYDAARMQFVNRGFYRLPEAEYLKKRLAGASREDIAAGAQKHLEDVVCAYVADVVKRFAGKPSKVVLAGGVFANVKLNQRIAELPEVSDLFIFPHMGDGGLPAGAGMAALLEDGVRMPGVEELYLGRDITDERAAVVLREQGLAFETPVDLPGRVAEELGKGRVIAVVRGKMEYGPRALGNRTLLYQTTDPSVNDWLNKRLNRSEFMPFAPILREDVLPEYFSGQEKCGKALRYMTVTLQANERCRREAPAIVHVDGTARPQTVTAASNPFVYDVLGRYEQKTGLRILINTSFNMHEEPIVCTEEDAVRAFLLGNIDMLVLGNHLVTHPSLRS